MPNIVLRLFAFGHRGIAVEYWSSIREWAAVHWVLWPSMSVALLLYVVACWSYWRHTHRSKILFLMMHLSFIFGCCIVVLALVEDTPSWFRRSSVLSALGVLSIFAALISFVAAHMWMGDVTKELQGANAKAVARWRNAIAEKLGLKE